MSGKSQVKTLSKAFQIRPLTTTLEIILMIGLGMLAIFLHAKLRTPLKLPGHHGLEFMAIIIAGRYFSRTKIATSFSALGIACLAFIPALGFKDPFMALVLTVPCFMIDILFNWIKNKRTIVVILALIAGLSYLTIPITRFIIQSTTGFVYSSLLSGLAFPVLTHFAFGFVGGLIGAGLMHGIKEKLFKHR